jgi:hypothetical protein
MNNSIKISVKNGANVISFELSNVIGETIETETVTMLATEVINELSNLYNTNEKLKAIGYKGNFFKFTKGRKCVLSIDVITETENFTLTKGIEFSFGKLHLLDSPIDGLHIILAGSINKRALIC